MSELTFWLGQVASGERNAFCGVGCGSETDRDKTMGVHVSDGTGRMKLVCPNCASRYAADLARLADIPPRKLRIADVMGEPQSPRYILSPLPEVIDQPLDPCPEPEECPPSEPSDPPDEISP
jgi:hypothetical protein